MPRAKHQKPRELTRQIKPLSTAWALTQEIDGHIGRFLGPS
jgi:hypothetical protein